MEGWKIVGNKMTVKLVEVKDHYSEFPSVLKEGVVKEWENFSEPLLEVWLLLLERGLVEMVLSMYDFVLNIILGGMF